jgi:hypothetical protein
LMLHVKKTNKSASELADINNGLLRTLFSLEGSLECL